MPVQHSKILGVSYDNHPIYGKYGYANAVDKNSEIVEITSGYKLKTNLSISRPPIARFPIGSLAEDYEFDHNGDLDEHNGRFMVTPEYPNGVYAYIATSGFPYFIGDTYKSRVDKYNTYKTDNNSKLPKDSVRVINTNLNNITKPQEILGTDIISCGELTRGQLTSIFIDTKGFNYKVNDNVVFDVKKNPPIAKVEWVVGKNNTITINNDNTIVTTVTPHQLTSGDLIELLESELKSTQVVEHIITVNDTIIYNNDNIHKLILPVSSNYDNSSIYLSEDPEGQIIYNDVDIIQYININNINCKSIIIYPHKNRPNILFLNTIYKKTKTSLNASLLLKPTSLLGVHPVTIIDPTNFRINVVNVLYGNIIDLKYITNSTTANGGIAKINLIYPGNNLKNIPRITSIISDSGYGALIFPISDTIGKVKSVKNINLGAFYNNNPTINYKFKTDTVLRIKFNNTIDSLKIINSGINYIIPPVIEDLDIPLQIRNGKVVSGRIVYGGVYWEDTPNLYINNNLSGGLGASILGLLKKSNIKINTEIYYGKTLESAIAKALVTYYDINASTIQLTYLTGNIEIINDSMYLWDSSGNKIGKIDAVINCKISTKSSNSKKLIEDISNNDVLKTTNRLHNNNKYQAYSYTIKSQHDLIDYKPIINANTHPAGLKLTAVRELDNIIQLYIRSQTKIRNSVSFKVLINNLLLIPIKLNYLKWYLFIHSNPHNNYKNTQFRKRIIGMCYYDDNYVYSNYKKLDNYNVGDKIWLTDSYYRYIRKIITPNKVLTSGEVVVEFPTGTNTSNYNNLVTYAGILQHPDTNYTAFGKTITLHSEILYKADKIVLKTFDTQFVFTDNNVLNNNNNLELTRNNEIYQVLDSNKIIPIVDGIPLSPNDWTLSNNSLIISNPSNYENYGFLLTHPNLLILSLTKINTQIYNVNNTIIEHISNVILVVNGIIQSNTLFTITNNKIVLTTNIDVDTIFGWYIDTPSSAVIYEEYDVVTTTKPPLVSDAIIEPMFNNGRLIDFKILQSGYNYPEYLEITIKNTDGRGARAICTTDYSKIVDIKILTGGSGYSFGEVLISQVMSIETERYPNIIKNTQITNNNNNPTQQDAYTIPTIYETQSKHISSVPTTIENSKNLVYLSSTSLLNMILDVNIDTTQLSVVIGTSYSISSIEIPIILN